MKISHRIEDTRNRARTTARRCRGLAQLLIGPSKGDASVAAARMEEAEAILNRIIARGKPE